MRCPQCATHNREQAKFCSECGGKLPLFCSSCGTLLSFNAKFCDECGTAVAPAPEPTSDASPKDVAQAERRHLTVMFCDLADSTAMSGLMDPEQLRDLILEYQQACTSAIERFEGYVARYVGDGILAYFGFPRAHEDDAERAVRAGLDVVERVGRLHSQAIQDHGHRPAVRVGIATGPVVVGDIVGKGAAQQSTVLGETPNLAARLQGLASPNSIVVSPATRELLGEFFVYRNLGPQEVKGLEKPVNAWAVLAERRPASRFEASQRRRLTPLVGRDEELEILERRWQRVKAGEGQVVLISGDAGIGKSRLAQTLAAHVRDEQCEVLQCQCSPYHANSAFYPIITYLEHAAGVEHGDSDAQRMDKLEHLLERPGIDAETVVPLFASLLSIDTGGRYAPVRLEAERLKDRILTALVEQLFSLSHQHPLLLVF